MSSISCSLSSGRCRRMASRICSSTVYTGFMAFMAAWKTMEMWRQRNLRTSSYERGTRSVWFNKICPLIILAFSGKSFIKEMAIEVLPQPDSPTNPIASPRPK